MWNIALLTVMLALAGAYAHQARRAEAAVQQGAGISATAAAEEMAVYRGAVVRYFSAHDSERDTGVALATLRAEGMLRPWAQPAPERWSNYRAPDGTIYIYAPVAPRANLGAALAALSHGSLLAGIHRGGTTLYSPVHGDTGIPLAPLLARRDVPAGAPVWLAAAE